MRFTKLFLSFASLFFASITLAAQSLPEVKLKTLDGAVVSTSTFLEAKRPVIISFFGTWCKPCLRELDAIEEVYDDWHEECGVTLYAISINEGADVFKVKPIVHSHGWSFPVLLDTSLALKQAMGVSVVPSVIVLSGDGEVIFRKTGYVEGGEGEIIKAIRKAM